MEDIGSPSHDAYLDSVLVELRSAIANLNDDDIMRVIDHVRAEAGETLARKLVAELLRTAHNAITEPDRALCIETALARYDPSGGTR